MADFSDENSYLSKLDEFLVPISDRDKINNNYFTGGNFEKNQ